MKSKLLIKIIIIIIFPLFLFASCQKSKENKLIGEWLNQPMSNTTIETDNEQIWTFDAAANIKVEEIYEDTTFVYEGIYSVSSKNMGISGYYIQITNLSGLLDGRYKIKALDEKRLSLHRVELADGNTAGAFLWRDLIKK